MFHPELREEYIAHALEAFPFECVGLITPKGYVRVQNIAANPRQDFRVAGNVTEKYEILGVFHSHVNRRDAPSAEDMESQLTLNVPFGICSTDGERTSEPYFFGDVLWNDVMPYEGRSFRHGPRGTDNRADCYQLVRDVYKVDRGIVLPEWPRTDAWWNDGLNMYYDLAKPSGFRIMERGELPEKYDLGLVPLVRGSLSPTHAMVYMGNELVLHHLPDRLSKIDPIHGWMRRVSDWLRYVKND